MKNELESSVYFIYAEEVKRMKIGLSNHPERYVEQLQTGSPVELRLVAVCPGDIRNEMEFYSQYEAYRRHGEWFDLPQSEVDAIITQYGYTPPPIPDRPDSLGKSLNALAPLRVGGIAQAILDNKDNPVEVERIAKELLDLEPHLLEMLIEEGEEAPALA